MASDEWDDKGQGLPNFYILHIQMLRAFFFQNILFKPQRQRWQQYQGKMLRLLPQTLNSSKTSLPFLLVQEQVKRFQEDTVLYSQQTKFNFQPYITIKLSHSKV